MFTRFETWSDVVAFAKATGYLYYHAPLDARPVRVSVTLPKRKPRNSMVPGDGWKEVLRIDPGHRDADPFYAFGDHLSRMRKLEYGPECPAQLPGDRVTCRYRVGFEGTLLAVDDPRAWEGTGAFGPGLPDVDAVRAHVARHESLLESDGAKPVLWDFGKVYWDRDLTRVG